MNKTNRLARITLSALCCVAIAQPLSGQAPSDEQGTRTLFGAMGGLNFAKLSGEIPFSGGAEFGQTHTTFVVGGFARLRLSPIFGVEPEILYSRQGSDAAEYGGIENPVTVKLDYLEVPVLAVLTVPVRSNSVAPSLYAGPALAVRLSCTAEEDPAEGDATEDCSDDLKSTDFGLVLGGDVEIRLGRYSLLVGARYELGLTAIDESGDYDVKRRLASVVVGFGISPGR